MGRGNFIGNSNPGNTKVTMSKRITILGAGESGTGAAILAKQMGYEVFVSDGGKIKDRYKAELANETIDFEEGKHTEEIVLNTNLIIKSPGIPDSAEIIKRAKSKSIEIIDEVEFAFRNTSGQVIAITGTNGKTTTTLLTYHLMKTAGFNVALVGNVGFSFAREVASKNYDWYVLEISSFQLDGTNTFNPTIGILLNITPDHLDRYDYSMQKYVDSKFRLIKNMSTDHTFIYYADDEIITEEVAKRKVTPRQVKVSLSAAQKANVYFDRGAMNFSIGGEQFKFSQSETTLVGPHNVINTMAAVSATYLAGVSLDSIRAGLKSFKNAPHRLELVGTVKGVQFVNDSKATNVDSVVYALGSYNRPLIWIAGGIDKGNDYTKLEEQVMQKVKALICLGKDNEKLKNAFKHIVTVIKETQDVKELVHLAMEQAESDDVVLLSPACASFDLFKNYEDRGDQFRAAVKELENNLNVNKN